jgi:hypothetical protein
MRQTRGAGSLLLFQLVAASRADNTCFFEASRSANYSCLDATISWAGAIGKPQDEILACIL